MAKNKNKKNNQFKSRFELNDRTFSQELPEDTFKVNQNIIINYADGKTTYERSLNNGKVADGLFYYTLDEDSFALRDNKALYGDYFTSAQSGTNGISNNGIRIELGLQYLRDYKQITESLVAKIIENVSEEYEISEEDLSILTRHDALEQQEAILSRVKDKFNKGDEKLKEAFESIVELYKKEEEVKKMLSSSGSVYVQDKIEDHVKRECFGRIIGGITIGSLDGETKKALLESANRDKDEFLANIAQLGGNVDENFDKKDIEGFIKGAREAFDTKKRFNDAFDASASISNSNNLVAIGKLERMFELGGILRDSKPIPKQLLKDLSFYYENEPEKRRELNDLLRQRDKTKLYDFLQKDMQEMTKFEISTRFSGIKDSKQRADITKIFLSTSEEFAVNFGNYENVDQLLAQKDEIFRDRVVDYFLKSGEPNELSEEIFKKSNEWSNRLNNGENIEIEKLLTSGAEIVNLHNATNNKSMMKNIPEDSIDEFVAESFTNKSFANASKQALQNRKKPHKNVVRDLSVSEKIMQASESKYVDFAGDLLQRSANKLTLSRERLREFRSCLGKAGIKKKGMDTVIGNTSNCLDQFKDKITQDAERDISVLNSSLNGIGAMNPFAVLSMAIAKYKSGFPATVRKEIDDLSEDLMDITKKITSANKEVDRNARYQLYDNEMSDGFSINAIHDSQKRSFCDAVLKEAGIAEVVSANQNLDDYSRLDHQEVDNLIDKYTQYEIFEKRGVEKESILSQDDIAQVAKNFGEEINVDSAISTSVPRYGASLGGARAIDDELIRELREKGEIQKLDTEDDLHPTPIDSERDDVSEKLNLDEDYFDEDNYQEKASKEDRGLRNLSDLKNALMTINQLKSELAYRDVLVKQKMDQIFKSAKSGEISNTDVPEHIVKKVFGDQFSETKSVLRKMFLGAKGDDAEVEKFTELLRDKMGMDDYREIEDYINAKLDSIEAEMEEDRTKLMEALVMKNIDYIEDNMDKEPIASKFTPEQIKNMREEAILSFDPNSDKTESYRLNTLSQIIDMIKGADQESKESIKIFGRLADLSVHAVDNQNDISSIVIGAGKRGVKLDILDDIETYLDPDSARLSKERFSFLNTDSRDFFSEEMRTKMMNLKDVIDSEIVQGTVFEQEESQRNKFSVVIDSAIPNVDTVQEASKKFYEDRSIRQVADKLDSKELRQRDAMSL